MVNIKPITLQIDKDLWESFKDIVPRTITLNEALKQLIEREIEVNKDSGERIP